MRFYFVISAFILLLFSCQKADVIKIENECYYEKSGNDTIVMVCIPGSFTPDGDGLNDFFKPVINRGFGYVVEDSYYLKIKNQKGEDIFISKNENQGWDGTNRGISSKAGSYNYFLFIEMISGKKLKFAGQVQLIR